MLSTLTSSEISEWQAYDRIEPFGPYRADLRNAMLCQAVASSHGIETKVSDFMPDFRPPTPPQPQSIDEQLALIRALSAQFVGKP